MAPKKKTAAVEAAEAPAIKAPAKKAAAKKVEELYVQIAGQEFNISDVVAKAKAAAKEQMPGRKNAVNTCKVYVKPEEAAAYYVVNGELTGKIDL